jgi:hypothetical protein
MARGSIARLGWLALALGTMALTAPAAHAERKPAAALFLHLLDRYANDAPNRTDVEAAMAAELDMVPGAKQQLQQPIARWKAVPPARREAILGAAFTDLPLGRAISRERMEETFRRAVKSSVPVEVPGPAGSEGLQARIAHHVEYRVEYAGLHCREESDWDRGTNSDEPYVIFTMTDGARTWSQRTPIYGDIDSGNTRGPGAVPLQLFPESGSSSRSRSIGFVVTVMEHDEGDPDYYRAEIKTVVEAARVVASILGLPIPEMVRDVVVDVVNAIVGSGDDEIDTETASLGPRSMEQFGAADPTAAHGLSYHFKTDHRGDGARYEVMFRVREVRPRH